MAELLSSLVRLRHQPSSALLQHLMSSAQQQLHRMPAYQLATTAWAAVRLRSAAGPFLQQVAAACMQQPGLLAGMDVASVARLLWCFAEVREPAPQLFSAAEQQLAGRAAELDSHSLALVLWSHARLQQPCWQLLAAAGPLLQSCMSKFGPETLPLLLWSCTRLSQLPGPAAQRSSSEEAAAAAAALAHAAALAAEGGEQHHGASLAPVAPQHHLQGTPAPGMTVTMAGGAGAAGFQVMLGNGITMHAGAGLDHGSEHGEDEQEQDAVQQPAAESSSGSSSAGSPEQVQEALLQVACWYVSSRERMATMTGQGLALLMWSLAKGRRRPGGGVVKAAVPVLCSCGLCTVQCTTARGSSAVCCQ